MTEKEYLSLLHEASRETGYSLTGDDAAVVRPSTILSTDQFIEGTHFEWHHMSAEQLGHKAVVQALSDLAAMGARPTAVLTSLAWHPRHSEHIAEFINGMKRACLTYNAPLVGGDITRSNSLFYADVTVAGHTANPLLKSGAKPGDVLAVTGTLGDASAGLDIVLNDFSSRETHSELVRRYQQPEAQLRAMQNILNTLKVHAATDISDSLSKSLISLAESSGVGFVIDAEHVPISPALSAYAREVQKDVKSFVWNGGEDYQVLLALPQNTDPRTLTDHGLTAIGRVTDVPAYTLKLGDKTSPLTEVGWDPFAL